MLVDINEVRSEYSANFWRIVGFYSLSFCVLLSLGLCSDNNVLLLPLVIPSFLTLLLLLRYLSIPVVTISDYEVVVRRLFKKERIAFPDIVGFSPSDTYELFGWFELSGWLSDMYLNGFSFSTKNGHQYVFYEKYYKNAHELRAEFAKITNFQLQRLPSLSNNKLTEFNRPVPNKLSLILLIGSFIWFLFFLLLFVVLNISILGLLSLLFFMGILVSLKMLYENFRYTASVEVEGEVLRVKYLYLSKKTYIFRLNDIVDAHIVSMRNRALLTRCRAFSVMTSDFRRMVLMVGNLESNDIGNIMELLGKNNVPITTKSCES